MQYKKQIPKNTKRLVYYALVVIAVLLSTVLLLEKTGVTNFFKAKKPVTASNDQTTDSINYSPPTIEEKAAGDEQKTKITENTNTQDISKPNNAEIVIVDASQYNDEIEVRAFVANVLEKGTCTFKFSLGSISFTKTQPAFPDASTTPCTTLTVNRSEFYSSGKWNLLVTFDSDNSSGSKDQEVVINE